MRNLFLYLNIICDDCRSHAQFEISVTLYKIQNQKVAGPIGIIIKILSLNFSVEVTKYKIEIVIQANFKTKLINFYET